MNPNDLPDVSHETQADFAAQLSQVGMEKIEMPIRMRLQGHDYYLPAEISAYVSLDDPKAKGIHMSRLYLELKTRLQKEILTPATIRELLTAFLDSHKELSQRSYVHIQFLLPVERKALISQELGYRQYPVSMSGRMFSAGGKTELSLQMGFEVLYSSTCPCSAALSRRLLQDSFIQEFGDRDTVSPEQIRDWLGMESAIVAVPHAQRSIAEVKIQMQEASHAPDFVELIDRVESALGTPVQAAVKRVDEQEFARLNAMNLMFCEDASRKIRAQLEADPRITDYDIRVDHQESLHPHNAVSRVVKGVHGGFSV